MQLFANYRFKRQLPVRRFTLKVKRPRIIYLRPFILKQHFKRKKLSLPQIFAEPAGAEAFLVFFNTDKVPALGIFEKPNICKYSYFRQIPALLLGRHNEIAGAVIIPESTISKLHLTNNGFILILSQIKTEFVGRENKRFKVIFKSPQAFSGHFASF